MRGRRGGARGAGRGEGAEGARAWRQGARTSQCQPPRPVARFTTHSRPIRERLVRALPTISTRVARGRVLSGAAAPPPRPSCVLADDGEPWDTWKDSRQGAGQASSGTGTASAAIVDLGPSRIQQAGADGPGNTERMTGRNRGAKRMSIREEAGCRFLERKSCPALPPERVTLGAIFWRGVKEPNAAPAGPGVTRRERAPRARGRCRSAHPMEARHTHACVRHAPAGAAHGWVGAPPARCAARGHRARRCLPSGGSARTAAPAAVHDGREAASVGCRGAAPPGQ